LHRIPPSLRLPRSPAEVLQRGKTIWPINEDVAKGTDLHPLPPSLSPLAALGAGSLPAGRGAGRARIICCRLTGCCRLSVVSRAYAFQRRENQSGNFMFSGKVIRAHPGERGPWTPSKGANERTGHYFRLARRLPSGSHAPAWEQVLTLQRHQAWPPERPRWHSHAGAWERAKSVSF